MIPKDLDTAHAEVVKLVQTFEKNLSHYKRPEYGESQVRKDFIDKFFIALGWDVNHEVQRNPYAQEVKVEPSVTVAERVKKADYSFALAPNFRDVHFFVEAKKPSVDIGTAENCFQIIRYAYSSNRAALSIITDFEQLHVMDCRFRPDISTAKDQIHQKYYFTDFLDIEKFAKLYYLFGREAVENGSLAKYASELPKPKGAARQRKLAADGYQEVDESFLQMLEGFRSELARMFKRKNQHLDSRSLTEAVQRTIDRLVFIRFLEDKLIEPSTILDKFADSRNAWRQFIAKSREFDKTYNGIIFKEHGIIDSGDFEVDDRVFLSLCDELASDRSPYHFNYIPIHILGSIYERFLGNVIVATAKRATVEAKPEVRKAGGVFYTPQYIVDYIVENTVGELVKAKTPADVAQMRFADIACGSGSFLLGVYECLLQWHTEYYNRKSNAKEAREAGCIVNEDGTFHLSFEQKKEILVNNIYGVDIDRQAHEVTQLSLYLKLLEEETLSTKRKLFDTTRKAMLPNLSNNIVCGNALVDWDINDGKLMFEPEPGAVASGSSQLQQLNPMSFEAKFPEIMRNGGFDAIVGNPPYGAEISDDNEKKYIARNYSSYKYKFDSYIYFIERALKLVSPEGFVGYITPEVWLRLESCVNLRKCIADLAAFTKVRICGENVFEQAVVNTIVPIFRVGIEAKSLIVETQEKTYAIPSADWLTSANLVIDYRLGSDERLLVNKIRERSESLDQFGEAIQGITAYDKYTGQSPELIKRRGYHFDHKADETCGKWLAGGDISRYTITWSGEWLSYGDWLGAPREHRFFEGNRILFREIPGVGKRIQATTANEVFYHGHSITPFKVFAESTININYIAGLANSKLLSWYGGLILPNFGKNIFPKLNPQDIKALPIHRPHDGDADEKALHDLIVRSVKEIMDAKKKLAAAVNESDRDFWTNNCDRLERTIDNAVYKLYDLTPDEIKLIEAS